MLAGSGGSVEGLLFANWTEQFNQRNSAIHVTYFTTNSADGINALISHAGDFAAGDIPLSAARLGEKSEQLAEIPVAVVGVALVYNLPGSVQLRFTGDLLAQIYMGNISRWNDNRISALNPGVSLPNLPIIVINRPVGSGTRHIFFEFLCKSNPAFCQWNKNEHPRMPKEVEVSGGQGVAEKVTSTEGAIGYVNGALASQYRLAHGSIRNTAGNFIKASGSTISAAYAAKRAMISEDLNTPLVDAPGEQSYPIVGFAWVYLPVHGITPERTQALHKFLNWCLGDGQPLIGHDFVPLPESVAAQAKAKLDAVLGPSR